MPTTNSRPTTDSRPSSSGPKTEHGKAISSRNATTHGVFARDVVLPALGEDPAGYRQMQDEWTQQLTPRNLLEQHYVEKIAAASWRLRRLHRWQAQLFEDPALSEDERLDRLDKVLRHETALQRQIDTAVKMLARDVPQLYSRRLRDQVLEDLHVTERECRDEPETDLSVSLETNNRLYQLKKATTQAAHELSEAPLDAAHDEICQNELPPSVRDAEEPEEAALKVINGETHGNEPVPLAFHPGLAPVSSKSFPRPKASPHHGPPGHITGRKEQANGRLPVREGGH